MKEAILILFLVPFVIAILGLLVWSLIWAYRDAENRGKPGWLIVLLVLFMNWPFSLLIWLAFRPELKEPPVKAG